MKLVGFGFEALWVSLGSVAVWILIIHRFDLRNHTSCLSTTCELSPDSSGLVKVLLELASLHWVALDWVDEPVVTQVTHVVFISNLLVSSTDLLLFILVDPLLSHYSLAKQLCFLFLKTIKIFKI